MSDGWSCRIMVSDSSRGRNGSAVLCWMAAGSLDDPQCRAVGWGGGMSIHDDCEYTLLLYAGGWLRSISLESPWYPLVGIPIGGVHAPTRPG